MTITIRLSTDNAAFAPDKSQEIRRILEVWITDGRRAGTLRDLNGNAVGSVKVVGR